MTDLTKKQHMTALPIHFDNLDKINEILITLSII